MTLRSYDLRSPTELITQVADAVPLEKDSAYLVLVEHPSRQQRIVTIRRLETPALIDDYEGAREEIYSVMGTLPVPERAGPPRHLAMSVLARRGLCVLGPNEGCWMSAWRYSNHLMNVYDGGVVLVTEHGWCDFMSDTAGLSPAMAA